MKISVIIPAHNCAKYIAQTLNCIQTQTFPTKNIEVIIVLDGCTDNTADIINDFVATHPQLRVHTIVHDAPTGPGIARNDGVRAAHGDYIHFMDADDIINTEFYERLYAAVTQTDCDVAVAGLVNEGAPESNILFHTTQVVSCAPDKFSATQVDMWGFSVRYLIRRAFWNKLKLSFPTDIIYAEDVFPMVQMVYAARSIVLVPGAEYTYKCRPSSLLHSPDRAGRSASDIMTVRRRVDEFLVRHDLPRSGVPMVRMKYKLFGVIPLLTYRTTDARMYDTFYLFGIIPILKKRVSRYIKPWKIKI